MNSPAASASSPPPAGRLRRFGRGAGAALSRYADWLAGVSWGRFFLGALLALIAAGILSQLPPFSIAWGPDRQVVLPPRAVSVSDDDVDVRIDSSGVHISQRSKAASAPSAGTSGVPKPPAIPSIDIPLPPGAAGEEVREALEEAKEEIREALKGEPRVRVVKAFTPGDHLPQLMALLIVASILVKVMSAGRKKAEARAAEATEVAESEALKRQVVEARMAAMQAQVEPHFLFNPLASIDHRIATDSARASRMQKNLIALLRASMPTMRETAAAGAPRDLERELAVVRPYLEILKMRMEERLSVSIDIPDGLLSAEFPPMMMQSLVENAVKHGLEPKAEGGALTLRAEIVHGKLALTVADTGLGFGKASAGAGPLPSQPTPPRGAASEASVGARSSTAGTGVGLANIRERLQLLYGAKATLTVSENKPSGTVVTITVPYVAHARKDDE